MMWVYVDDKYIYDNASSPQVLGGIIEDYCLKYKGHKIKFVIEFP